MEGKFNFFLEKNKPRMNIITRGLFSGVKKQKLLNILINDIFKHFLLSTFHFRLSIFRSNF